MTAKTMVGYARSARRMLKIFEFDSYNQVCLEEVKGCSMLLKNVP